ncbi:MAG: Txe/YoeB family addiction module toxin [Snowella sp.]|nr:Txe/YoeB family addiction module toxin [Snowella sp.]
MGRNDKKQSGEPPKTHHKPLFSPDFKADLRWWYRTDSKKADKILDLVADILDGDPFQGIGKPEPLKYIDSNTWSRRIDLEHRLVYQVKENCIFFLQARYHYQAD